MNWKFSIFLATAASCCCGFSSSVSAQTRVKTERWAPQARLTAIQIASDDFSPLSFGGDPSEGVPDPQSLPIATHRGQNPVDSIIENSAPLGIDPIVQGGTHFAPLYWSHTSHVHTAFPDYMRLQWCADGLWDSFPAERAAQCALQAARISGAHRHGCGHCAGAGCGCAGAAGECQPVNRYRLKRHAGCSSCGTHSCGEGRACDASIECDSIPQPTTTDATPTESTMSAKSAESTFASTEQAAQPAPFKIIFLTSGTSR